ncbi:uncharacterized protein isoform X1 [Musca autumnalis]|uniref:uncharacterized protein isoform X1 n=1 Tax=Musca autumnalis TaxID=221902 RepID=UPI003CEED5E6
MLKDMINEFLEKNDVIPARSFAYRKGLSTASCLNEFLHRVALLKTNNYKVLVLSLDINNAYNCVRVDFLARILNDIRLNPLISRWIINFLSSRILRLGSKEIEVTNGLPQGSCLSPILFNIYTAKLHELEDSRTKIFQYADDFLLMVFDRDFDVASGHLQSKVRSFQRMCGSLNLSFNPSKSNSIYFAKNSVKQISLNVDGFQIEQVKKLKFLGRIVTNSMTVRDHYDFISEEVKNRVNLLKCLSAIRGGLHPKVSLNTYKSFVRSKIEYGRTTTANAPEYINKKIERLQNDMIRRSLGVPKTTPIHTRYALAGELPPKYRAKLLTAKEIIRNVTKNERLYDIIADNPRVKSSYSAVFHEFADILQRIKAVQHSSHAILKTRVNVLPGVKNNMPAEVIRATYNAELNFYTQNDFTVFATDASIAQEATGCGVFNVTKNQKFLFNLCFRSSSTFGELYAIRKALDIAAEDGYYKVVIFTDSLAACKALGSVETDNFLVAECHNIVRESNMERCHVVWTPGHCGITMNEEVDYLSKQAVEVGAPLEPFLTPAEALNQIEFRLKSWWNEEYQCLSQEKGRFFYGIVNNIFEKPWYSKINLNAADTKLYNRLLVGHMYDKVYLKRIGACQDDVCEQASNFGFAWMYFLVEYL